MGLGASIVLVAVGAVLLWAVDASVAGVELDTVGFILLVVGIAGALLWLVLWSTWGRFEGTGEHAVERVEPPAGKR